MENKNPVAFVCNLKFKKRPCIFLSTRENLPNISFNVVSILLKSIVMCTITVKVKRTE